MRILIKKVIRNCIIRLRLKVLTDDEGDWHVLELALVQAVTGGIKGDTRSLHDGSHWTGSPGEGLDRRSFLCLLTKLKEHGFEIRSMKGPLNPKPLNPKP